MAEAANFVACAIRELVFPSSAVVTRTEIPGDNARRGTRSVARARGVFRLVFVQLAIS